VTFFLERLGRHHVRDRFRSGQQELNAWFRHRAGQAQRRHGSARVWVVCDDELHEGTHPIGYFALTAHMVDAAVVPPGLGKGQPPGLPVGAALLARLAIDGGYQGRGLGRRLLADAVRTVAAADDQVALPLLVVDAIDEAAARFYEHHGFRRLPGRELRLGARLVDLRKLFG
jgi:GNAT superfamily N-acetyltransferase